MKVSFVLVFTEELFRIIRDFFVRLQSGEMVKIARLMATGLR